MTKEERVARRLAAAAASLGLDRIERADVKRANRVLAERPAEEAARRVRRRSQAEGETFRVLVATFGDQ